MRTLDELYLAYRQAKIALWAERRGVGMLDIAHFEGRLAPGLTALLVTLSENGGWFDGIDVGAIAAIPKRLKLPERSDERSTYFGPKGFPEQAELEVRFQLRPSLAFAIVEILYLWQFGAVIDATVPDESVGYRLLRTKRGRAPRATARWLFEYWPKRYAEFRSEPMAAARKLLRQRGKTGSCTLVSIDISSFYDNVAADFLVEPSFIVELEGAAAGRGLTFDRTEYLDATRSLIDAYARFQRKIERATGVGNPRGVPIGALTSRVVANAALAPLDRYLAAQKSIVCTRRYVDDISFVAMGTGGVDDAPRDTLAQFVPLRAPSEDGAYRLDEDTIERPRSRFAVQPRKLRIYHLAGLQGLDFVASVDGELARLSSERRALADTAILSGVRTVPMVRPFGESLSGVRVLRDVDRVGVEHFAVSISLKTLERAARLLPPAEARDVVRPAIEPLLRAVADPAAWADHTDVMFRVLSLVTLTEDTELAIQIVTQTESVWATLTSGQTKWRVSWNGAAVRPRRTLAAVRRYLRDRRLETVCAAVNSPATFPPLPWRARALGPTALRRRAALLAEADLRMLDREDDHDRGPRRSDTAQATLNQLLMAGDLGDRMTAIDGFVARADHVGDVVWKTTPAALFLSTRPPSYFDVARRWLYLAEAEETLDDSLFEGLRGAVNALRGTEYYLPAATAAPRRMVVVGEERDRSEPGKVRVILGNLSTNTDAWTRAASDGRPQAAIRSRERLLALARVLERADAAAGIDGDGLRRALLVLPELSLPRAWLRELGRLVSRDLRIGVVAGLEYQHHRTQPVVYNQAVAIIPDRFAVSFVWTWTKRRPAAEEKAHLADLRPPRSFPRWKRPVFPRAVLRTRYGDFSVLICSELIEARLVGDLVGRTDMVLVPSWNQDTASYDHLVQSAGLQLHAYVCVANNGVYSDCRIWAPKAERWRRDVCRLIERGCDDVVFADLDVASLRDFHAGTAAGKKNTRTEYAWKALPPDWRWPR